MELNVPLNDSCRDALMLPANNFHRNDMPNRIRFSLLNRTSGAAEQQPESEPTNTGGAASQSASQRSGGFARLGGAIRNAQQFMVHRLGMQNARSGEDFAAGSPSRAVRTRERSHSATLRPGIDGERPALESITSARGRNLRISRSVGDFLGRLAPTQERGSPPPAQQETAPDMQAVREELFGGGRSAAGSSSQHQDTGFTLRGVASMSHLRPVRPLPHQFNSADIHRLLEELPGLISAAQTSQPLSQDEIRAQEAVLREILSRCEGESEHEGAGQLPYTEQQWHAVCDTLIRQTQGAKSASTREADSKELEALIPKFEQLRGAWNNPEPIQWDKNKEENQYLLICSLVKQRHDAIAPSRDSFDLT